MTLSEFSALAATGQNIWLTGQAGTGKSHLLRQWLATDGRNADVTAPTGIAALNIGGMTIHRFCGIGIGPKDGESIGDFIEHLSEQQSPSVRDARQRIRACSVLVCDETSMISGRLLDTVDAWFRHVRGRMSPFGGAQLICLGDALQLPPVRRDQSQPYDWFFESESWQRGHFQRVGLTKVWRQDEPELIATLNDVRRGRLTPSARKTLGRCVRMFPPANLTRLCTHNRDVDRINNTMLSELPGQEHTYTAEFWPGINENPQANQRVREFFEKNSITPLELRLKVDARVSFTVNDAQGRFVNGTSGRVARLSPFSVDVETDDGRIVGVDPFSWNIDPRNRRAGGMTQLPLRLAYASTIHRAQGLSLDGAYIDIRAARDAGQAYVALSRVKTLAGMWLKASPSWIAVCPRALEFQEKGK